VQVPKHEKLDKVVSISTVFFFQHTIFLCETALFGNDQITKQYKVTPCYDLLGTHGVELLGTHGVELLLHLAEHGLMKLVPIYMF
jgi:hypothetical protein